MIETDCLIVGAGPVGIFSVFQAGMLGIKCHVVESLDFTGGQCSALYPEKPIYDIPGYPEILASDLIEKLKIQASPFNPTYHLSQRVEDITKDGEYFVTRTSFGEKIKSKIVIISAGNGSFGPNKPPIPNIEEYEEKSLFYSVKSKEIFRDKIVSIAGGGDSALDWAIILSDIAKKVYLIHRREKFRAHEVTINKVQEVSKDGRIEFAIPYHLHSLEGEGGYIENINLEYEGNTKTLKSDYLLSFFGIKSDLGSLKSLGFEMESNHIKVDESFYQTNINGIYAVGDVCMYKGKVKLILTGFAESSSALHHAYSRIFDKPLHFQYSTTKGIKSI